MLSALPFHLKPKDAFCGVVTRKIQTGATWKGLVVVRSKVKVRKEVKDGKSIVATWTC